MAQERKTVKSKPGSSELTYFIALGGVAGVFNVIYGISMMTGTAPCPAGTFWSGSQPNVGALLAGSMATLIGIALGTLLATTLLNANLIAKSGAIALAARHKTRLACIIAPCALTAVFCWFDVTGSSYCLQPDSIRVREAFSPEQTIPWGDVTTVIGDCVASRSGRYGILRLKLTNQKTVGVSFRTLDTIAFAETERSLSQVGYRYQFGQGLIAGHCPPGVAALLIGLSKVHNGLPM